MKERKQQQYKKNNRRASFEAKWEVKKYGNTWRRAETRKKSEKEFRKTDKNERRKNKTERKKGMQVKQKE